MASTNNSNNQTPTQLGRYHVVRELARSNDIVYEAIDPTMNRRVALKELNLPANLAGQQRRERLERFYREAKAAGTLNHRHIVTIYEIGQEKDRHFIAMEFLDGQSLRDYLNVNGPLPIKLALQIGLDLCDALGYAHTQGVIHRDVKPDNVHLIAPGHTAKLTDFGIARVMEDPALTTNGQVFGTPSYMSPEQLMAKNVDHRTDLFSLSVLLYEIITGKKPFPGDNIQSITYAIVNSPVTFPSGTPAGITGILRRGLAKDPEQRYPNAHAMATDIRMELMFLGSQHQYPGSTSPAFSDPPPPLKSVSPAVSVPVEDDGTVLSVQAVDQSAALPDEPLASNITDQTEPVRKPADFVPQPSTYYAPPVQPTGNPVAILIVSVTAIVLLIAMTIGAVTMTIRNTRLANERASAISHYNSGSAALDASDPQTAVTEYTKAIALAPPGDTLIGNARRNLAVAYVTLGDQAASTDAPAAQTYYKLALTSGAQTAIVHFKLAKITAEPSEAIKEYEKAISGDPNGQIGNQARKSAAALYFQQADTAMANHDSTTARNYYNHVIELTPSDPLAQQARQRLTSTGL